MKKILLAGLVILLGNVGFAQLIISGDTCSNTPQYDYSFENYQIGTHIYGYYIYRNGSIVYQEEKYYDYVAVYHMQFINDATGFMYKSPDAIWRSDTYGESWENWGSFAPQVNYNDHTFDDFYFLSPEIGYYGIYYLYNDSIYLYRNEPGFLNYTLLSKIDYNAQSQFLTVYDTIPDPGYYCGNLEHLLFTWNIGDDTVQIDLRFSLTGTSGISEGALKNLNLYPNPTNGHIHIDAGCQLRDVKIRVFNIVGQVIAVYSFPETLKAELNIPGPPGLYFLEVTAEGLKTQLFKVLKL
jgi:hypothetical protein